MSRDGTGGDLLHLLVQHMDSRLRLYDEITDDHSNGDKYPIIGMAGDAAAQKAAHGHKSHVHAHQEDGQSYVHIHQTDDHVQYLLALESAGHQLEQDQESADRQQRRCRLLQIVRYLAEIQIEHLHRVLGIRHDRRGVGASVRLIQQSKDQHRDDRPDRAQRHQAEAVAPCLLVASHGAHAHAQCHDERHRHGSSGHASGVKSHRPEIRRHEHRQTEYDGIKPDQQPPQLDTQHDTQQGDDQEHTHAHRHGPDDHVVLNGRYLVGQHLQIRLRHGNDHADEEAHHRDDPHLLSPCDLGAYRLSQRDHGHLRPQREQSHAGDQHHAAQQERHHGVVGHRCNGEAQHQHDKHHRQYRCQRLVQRFFEYSKDVFRLLPFFTQSRLLVLNSPVAQVYLPFLVLHSLYQKAAHLSVSGRHASAS